MARLSTITVITLLLATLLLGAQGKDHDDELRAECEMDVDTGVPEYTLSGKVTLKQKKSGGDTTIDIDISGFNDTEVGSSHGFHVHQYGNLSTECKAAGGHFNPLSKNHGAPTDTDRHVGDLGNVNVTEGGKMDITITDSQVSLTGDNSVIGKAIVVHVGTDDLGLGGQSDSKTTGHAGARAACCIITDKTTGSATHNRYSTVLVSLLALTLALAQL